MRVSRVAIHREPLLPRTEGPPGGSRGDSRLLVTAELLREVDRRLDGIVGIVLQKSVPGGLVNGGEPVEAPDPPLQELDVHLHGLAEDENIPRSWAVPCERQPGDMVLLEDPEDGGRRDEDLVVTASGSS